MFIENSLLLNQYTRGPVLLDINKLVWGEALDLGSNCKVTCCKNLPSIFDTLLSYLLP